MNWLAGKIFFAPPLPALVERLPGQVWLCGQDPEALAAVLGQFPDKIVGLDYDGPLDQMDHLPPLEQMDKVALRVWADGSEPLGRELERLPKERSQVALAHGPEMIQRIKEVASLGLALDLSDSVDRMSPEQMDQVLELYLHGGQLSAPLQPWHAVLQDLMGIQEFDLWMALRQNPERLLFLDPQGNLAASRADLEQGRMLGRLDDDWQTIRESKPYMQWDQYLRGLARQQPRCLDCPHFHLCRGCALYGRDHCAAWLRLFEGLAQTARELIRLRRQAELLGLEEKDLEQPEG